MDHLTVFSIPLLSKSSTGVTLNSWSPSGNEGVVYRPVVPEPHSTTFPSSVHSNVARSVVLHVNVCRLLLVLGGLLLVIVSPGPVVSIRNEQDVQNAC